MILDTASSTARMMERQCSGENPSDSISGPIAPRTTQSNCGWLRSSSLRRKARRTFEDRCLFRDCFVSEVFIFSFNSSRHPSRRRGIMARKHNLAPEAMDFCRQARMGEQVNFVKNMELLGALLMLVETTEPWPLVAPRVA